MIDRAAGLLLALCVAAPAAAAPKNSAALVEAAGKGDVAAVKALLDSGARVDARSGGRRRAPFYHEQGVTPLCAAAAAGSSPVVELLLERGADRFKTCRQRFLFWGLGDSKAHGYTPLLIAAQRGNAAVVRDLLNEPTAYALGDVNGQRAAMCPDAPCIDSVGVIVPTLYFPIAGWRHRDNALETAELYRSTDALRAIIERVGPEAPLRAKEISSPGGAIVTSPSPLLWAASLGDADLVRWLLRRGADPERTDSAGRIALQVALDNGRAAAAVVIKSFMTQDIRAGETAQAVRAPREAQDLGAMIFAGDPYQSSDAMNAVAALEGSGDETGALQRVQEAVAQTGLTLGLAEEAAKAGAALHPEPPAEAVSARAAAQAIFNAARDEADYEAAVAAMAKALRAAPWWGDGWRDLSQMLAAADDDSDAVASLEIYLYSGPPPQDAAAAQARIDALRKEMGEEQGAVP